MGAFGAHGLRERLEPADLEVWRTAVTYHGAHAVGIVLCGLLARVGGVRGRPAALRAAACFLFGILLFSGSLYALALGGPRWLGPLTPIGGVLLLLGWLVLAFGGRDRVDSP